eukprot:5512484-Alexandrium_andersonii.AAC.1
MVLSPFRPCGVVVRWPYLGISAGCRAAEGVPPPGQRGRPEYRRMVSATWSKAASERQGRSQTLASS